MPEHAPLVSVLPGRLAVAPTRSLPLSVRDDDHEHVAIQAERWQQCELKLIDYKLEPRARRSAYLRYFERPIGT